MALISRAMIPPWTGKLLVAPAVMVEGSGQMKWEAIFTITARIIKTHCGTYDGETGREFTSDRRIAECDLPHLQAIRGDADVWNAWEVA